MATTGGVEFAQGRYVLHQVIGRGSGGRVFRATQNPLGRAVAIKVLDPRFASSGAEPRRRFFIEASAVAKLSHPNTVRVFDYGETRDGTLYMAMEFLEGRTLHRVLREDGPLSAERVIHIATAVCEALAEAHREGLVHRDLKPANLMLCERFDLPDFVKVLDFGIVQELGGQLDRAGLVLGSPQYMSPEQVLARPVDGRSDIYSLGVVMVRLLTGKYPFGEGLSAKESLRAHLRAEPIPLAELAPELEIPRELDLVVQRCLAKRPENRFGTMDDLRGALLACERMMKADTSLSLGELPTLIRMRQRPGPIAAAVVLPTLLIAASALAWVAWPEPRPPEIVVIDAAPPPTLPMDEGVEPERIEMVATPRGEREGEADVEEGLRVRKPVIRKNRSSKWRVVRPQPATPAAPATPDELVTGPWGDLGPDPAWDVAGPWGGRADGDDWMVTLEFQPGRKLSALAIFQGRQVVMDGTWASRDDHLEVVLVDASVQPPVVYEGRVDNDGGRGNVVVGGKRAGRWKLNR